MLKKSTSFGDKQFADSRWVRPCSCIVWSKGSINETLHSDWHAGHMQRIVSAMLCWRRQNTERLGRKGEGERREIGGERVGEWESRGEKRREEEKRGEERRGEGGREGRREGGRERGTLTINLKQLSGARESGRTKILEGPPQDTIETRIWWAPGAWNVRGENLLNRALLSWSRNGVTHISVHHSKRKLEELWKPLII